MISCILLRCTGVPIPCPVPCTVYLGFLSAQELPYIQCGLRLRNNEKKCMVLYIRFVKYENCARAKQRKPYTDVTDLDVDVHINLLHTYKHTYANKVKNKRHVCVQVERNNFSRTVFKSTVSPQTLIRKESARIFSR